MNINTLITELKKKLSEPAAASLERLVATPEAQAIIARDEAEGLVIRRKQAEQLKAVMGGKYAKELAATEKSAMAVRQHMELCEQELAAAKSANQAAQSAGMAVRNAEERERYELEQALIATSDSRLAEFKHWLTYASSIVRHAVIGHLGTTKHWLTREASTTYRSNLDEVSALRAKLAELVEQCDVMRLQPLTRHEVTERLTSMSHAIAGALNAAGLPTLSLDDTGAVKFERTGRMDEVTESVIVKARGIGNAIEA
jgi:hypothetical protein